MCRAVANIRVYNKTIGQLLTSHPACKLMAKMPGYVNKKLHQRERYAYLHQLTNLANPKDLQAEDRANSPGSRSSGVQLKLSYEHVGKGKRSGTVRYNDEDITDTLSEL